MKVLIEKVKSFWIVKEGEKERGSHHQFMNAVNHGLAMMRDHHHQNPATECELVIRQENERPTESTT